MFPESRKVIKSDFIHGVFGWKAHGRVLLLFHLIPRDGRE